MQKMTTPSRTTLTPPHTITHTLAQVYKLLRTQGHNVVAVFTIPDVKGRPDPLAEAAESDKVPVFKFPRWRTKGKPLPEVRQLVVCPVAAILECVCVCGEVEGCVCGEVEGCVWGGGGMCVGRWRDVCVGRWRCVHACIT